MAFYSIAYTYYDLLLQISQAGIPFAIAALVAKYIAKDDYKTVLLIKKLGISIVIGLSVFMGFALILMSEPLARQSLGISAPINDIENLKITFYILTIAVIIVPLLSAYRGYIQGLKRLDLYASSQVLEQLVRVLSIICFAYLFVSLLKFESIWAIFIAVAAASLGAFVAYLFTHHLAKNDDLHIEELANNQSSDALANEKEIIKEIMTLGIPYVIISFLSTAGPLVNTTFFLDYITKVNGPQVYENSKLASGILQANIAKISNIPSVLALGFGSGMVPYLSESLEKNDYQKISKQINEILDTVMYILIPLIAIFVFFAKDIYYIMYGNNNLDLGSNLFMVSNIQILLGTIAPIFSSIMMSLKLRMQAITTLIISFLIKIISFFPLVKLANAYGMIYSSGFYYLAQILLYFYFLRSHYDISIKDSLKKLLSITLSALFMILPVLVIHKLIPFNYDSRIKDIIIMGGLGIIMLPTYFYISSFFKLPQIIFNLEDSSIKSLLRKIRP